MTQAREYPVPNCLLVRWLTGMTYAAIVGLQIDCSAMVKSGRIKESDMLNRNWAYWTTFCQVRIVLLAHSVKCTDVQVRS